MSIRLDEAEPDHIRRDGGHVKSITCDGRGVGVARRYLDGWEATLWARPGKIRARWRWLLLRRIAAELAHPAPTWRVSEPAERDTV